MTRQEILDLSGLLTENKGKPLTQKLPTLFSFVCQDICKRKRFWWRKVTASFQTTIGAAAANYDLSSITTTPSISEIAVEEIISLLLVLPPAGSVPQFSPLTPIFDEVGRVSMLQNTQAGQPGRYGFINNDYKSLTLDPSDAVYTIYLSGWGMPNPATDDSSDSVPLIPPWGHNTIVHGMCKFIWQNAYGGMDERTQAYADLYEQGIADLAMKSQFTSDSNVQLVNTSDSAIRSTH